MNDRERLEKIQEVLTELSLLAEDHILLIEGSKDKRSLETLGIRGTVFMIQSEGGPMKAAEFVYRNNKKAVILTDWDRKGGTIASELSKQLSSLGVEYDTSVRARLSVLCKKYAKDVESLDSVVERLTADTSAIKTDDMIP